MKAYGNPQVCCRCRAVRPTGITLDGWASRQVGPMKERIHFCPDCRKGRTLDQGPSHYVPPKE